MPGWSADGTTHRHWRTCEHPYVREGRCFDCRAKEVDGFVQATHGGRMAVGMADFEPVITKGADITHFKGDADSRARFNRSIK